MHTARGKAHSALQRQKLIAEQNTKRATLSPPPRTLYVCVCVCVREAEAEEGVRVQTCTTPPSALRFYSEHVTLLKCRQTGT